MMWLGWLMVGFAAGLICSLFMGDERRPHRRRRRRPSPTAPPVELADAARRPRLPETWEA